MSFAAVVGARRACSSICHSASGDGAGRRKPGLAWLAQRSRIISSSAALTTLVASLAIAPFAIYHFHRMTHYGSRGES